MEFSCFIWVLPFTPMFITCLSVYPALVCRKIYFSEILFDLIGILRRRECTNWLILIVITLSLSLRRGAGGLKKANVNKVDWDGE